MGKRHLFLLLFIAPILTEAQNVVLTTCNEIQNSSARNQCLKASLENLLIKEVFRNLDFVNLQHEQPATMSVGINISRTGVFSISSISTPNFGLARSIHNVLKTINPIGEYKGERRSTGSSTFEFEFHFNLKNDNSIVVLDKNNETVYIKRDKTEKEILDEIEQSKIKSDSIAQLNQPIKEKDNEDVSFAIIEQVPIYPGCEDLNTNDERKDCMSKYITSMVINNFNSQLAANLGLSGRQRISVQFKIDTNGFITEIIARAPHPALEEESIRVINTLPRVMPGKQRGEKVNVLYSLPILFQVEGNDSKKK
jgi:hypothetical protein